MRPRTSSIGTQTSRKHVGATALTHFHAITADLKMTRRRTGSQRRLRSIGETESRRRAPDTRTWCVVVRRVRRSQSASGLLTRRRQDIVDQIRRPASSVHTACIEIQSSSSSSSLCVENTQYKSSDRELWTGQVRQQHLQLP